MKLCRHFDPVTSIRGCQAGRIAAIDCGPGCAVYDAASEPVNAELEELWNEHDEQVQVQQAQQE
jgi:hypothetical protein